MAPTKPSGSKGGKGGKSGGGKSGGKSAGRATKKNTKGSAPEGISKRKSKSLALAKPGGAQKTKSLPSKDGKKKRRVYSEAELNIPKLNSIVPAGIAKPKGQKKGKVFVDDPESMVAIMSMVNAEKEGHIESKIMKARQWEEVREAKRKEQEKRSEEKKAKFEEKKEGLKKKKNRHSDGGARVEEKDEKPAKKDKSAKKKRVSFG
jgi:60S ribosomal subunit assembly/export protein LOC1